MKSFRLRKAVLVDAMNSSDPTHEPSYLGIARHVLIGPDTDGGHVDA